MYLISLTRFTHRAIHWHVPSGKKSNSVVRFWPMAILVSCAFYSRDMAIAASQICLVSQENFKMKSQRNPGRLGALITNYLFRCGGSWSDINRGAPSPARANHSWRSSFHFIFVLHTEYSLDHSRLPSTMWLFISPLQSFGVGTMLTRASWQRYTSAIQSLC